MLLLFFALLTLAFSALLTKVAVIASARFGFGADESGGVQKFHSHSVSRVGGLPIFVAFVACSLTLTWITRTEISTTLNFIFCLLPAFGIGLAEDLTRRVGATTRLIVTMISAALAWWLLDGKLMRIDLPFIDTLLGSYAPLAFAFTLIAAAGITHAVNIIDGYNGLSGFFVSIVLFSLAWVAWDVGDIFICRAALLGGSATLGFLFWNFPKGHIFMGDSGAYLLGFAVALLSILLVARNPEVSPWFPMLLVMHPASELMFSICRRARYGFSEIGKPDALHLHSLIYRRLVKHYGPVRRIDLSTRRNATTSLYLWMATGLCAYPAIIFWQQTYPLMMFCGLFALSYILLYQKIVRFRTPKVFLVGARRRRKGASKPGGRGADFSKWLRKMNPLSQETPQR